MFKRILFAMLPLVVVAGAASADDDLLTKLAQMDDNAITATAEMSTDTDDELGQADVDALLGDDDKDEDAVAACFRRVGFGYGYGSSRYGYGSSRYGYSSYTSYRHYRYTPTCYSYSYVRPVTYHYTPVITHYTPVYTSYWGCY